MLATLVSTMCTVLRLDDKSKIADSSSFMEEDCAFEAKIDLAGESIKDVKLPHCQAALSVSPHCKQSAAFHQLLKEGAVAWLHFAHFIVKPTESYRPLFEDLSFAVRDVLHDIMYCSMRNDTRFGMHRLKERLAGEERKYTQWHEENQRRRHNFIPFIFNLLRILAEEGQIKSLVEKAQVPNKPQKQL